MNGETVQVPARGRFVVHDGQIYRVKDMWLEKSASDREQWAFVIWKAKVEA